MPAHPAARISPTACRRALLCATRVPETGLRPGHNEAGLLPDVDVFALFDEVVGTRGDEPLEVRFVAVCAGSDVVQDGLHMEALQCRVRSYHLVAVSVEQHDGRCVGEHGGDREVEHQTRRHLGESVESMDFK